MDYTFRRGDICWFRDREPSGKTFVKHGDRPVIIVSPDTANRTSGTVVAVPMTSKTDKKIYPGQFDVYFSGQRSRVCTDQIRVVDKSALDLPVAHADLNVLENLDAALAYTVGMFSAGTVVCLAE